MDGRYHSMVMVADHAHVQHCPVPFGAPLSSRVSKQSVPGDWLACHCAEGVPEPAGIVPHAWPPLLVQLVVIMSFASSAMCFDNDAACKIEHCLRTEH